MSGNSVVGRSLSTDKLATHLTDGITDNHGITLLADVDLKTDGNTCTLKNSAENVNQRDPRIALHELGKVILKGDIKIPMEQPLILKKDTNKSINRGLKVFLPCNNEIKRESTDTKLWYEIYAPQSYRISSSNRTFYLRINEIKVFGKGYILFFHKLPGRFRNTNRKAIVLDSKLRLPIPYEFHREIMANQFLGNLKIIPARYSAVESYDIMVDYWKKSDTLGIYTCRVNEIANTTSWAFTNPLWQSNQ